MRHSFLFNKLQMMMMMPVLLKLMAVVVQLMMAWLMSKTWVPSLQNDARYAF